MIRDIFIGSIQVDPASNVFYVVYTHTGIQPIRIGLSELTIDDPSAGANVTILNSNTLIATLDEQLLGTIQMIITFFRSKD